MPRSCDSPEPMRSPTTTSPVAIPTRTCTGKPAAVSSFGIASTRSSPADRALGIMLVGLGVPEIGEDAVATVFGDETAVAPYQLRVAALIGANNPPINGPKRSSFYHLVNRTRPR
jgi:hypothetical protein